MKKIVIIHVNHVIQLVQNAQMEQLTPASLVIQEMQKIFIKQLELQEEEQNV